MTIKHRLLYTISQAECAEIHFRVMVQETPEEVRARGAKDVKLTLVKEIAKEHNLTPRTVVEILCCVLGPVHVQAKHTAFELYEQRYGRRPPGRWIYPWKGITNNIQSVSGYGFTHP